MDFIIELIFEFLFDGMLETSKSNKVPKFIRYPLIVIILLFFVLVIGFIFIVSILAFKESIIAGILLIIIDLFLIIGTISKFRKEYFTIKENKIDKENNCG